MIRSDKPKASFFKRQKDKIRFGLFFQSMIYRLKSFGIEFTPFFLMQEGIENVTLIPMIKGMSDEYSFEFLGPDDMKGGFEGGLSEEESLYLLVNGGKCIGLKYYGEIAAYMWINLDKISYACLKIPLKDNEAYLWETRTMESYKGKNLAPFLRYKSYEILKEMNRDVLYSISGYFNTPTIKFKKKLNAKKLELILYIQFFNKFHWNFKLKTYLNHQVSIN